MTATVRCPAPGCRSEFELSRDRLGKNVYCLSCGTRMTARPVEVDRELARREHRTGVGAGATVERLPLAVLVDNVRSLWNVGSIFRTADGCGVEQVALCGITGCPPRAEIRKTALGAEEAIRWSYSPDPLDALERLTAEGYTPVSLEASPRAVPLDDMVWPERTCLVVGNEVAGVSPAVLEATRHHVSIPMAGIKDSFNVAVAFGIAAHRAATALVQSSSTVRLSIRSMSAPIGSPRAETRGEE